MSGPTFFAAGRSLFWNAAGRAFRLEDREAEMILNILEREHEHRLFNQLYSAHLATGGTERSSSLIWKAA